MSKIYRQKALKRQAFEQRNGIETKDTVYFIEKKTT